MTSIDNALEKAIARLRRLDDSGSVVLSDGSMLITKYKPRSKVVSSEAYLHEIYAPLNEEEIRNLEIVIGMELPADLRQFYARANGLSLFSGSLIICGFREDYSRDGRKILPVSIEYGNTIEIVAKSNDAGNEVKDSISIGFYSSGNGYNVSLKLIDPCEVILTPRSNLDPVLNSWTSFSEFLGLEVDRLCSEYKARGGDVDILNVLPAPLRIRAHEKGVYLDHS